MILDLSYNITVNGTKLASVNETSNKELAPQHAMYELGNVIPRIVWTLATADPSMPFLFTKIDLKDGYWRSESGFWEHPLNPSQVSPQGQAASSQGL